MVGETVAEQDNQQDLMTTQSYSRLAALIFAVVSGLRLIRAVSGWPITVSATTSIPLWANWVACVIAGVLAWIGFEASR
jgi:putative Mn2+ efflux pump MntP